MGWSTPNLGEPHARDPSNPTLRPKPALQSHWAAPPHCCCSIPKILSCLLSLQPFVCLGEGASKILSLAAPGVAAALEGGP